MKRIAVIVPALALVLSGCSAAEPESVVSQQKFLAGQGLDGMDAVEIINYLDRVPVPARATGLMASVRPDELLMAGQGQEFSLDLPEELTYVSVAPYVDQTHDCFFHSLTTCVGEMGNEPVRVTFTDAETGEKLVDGDFTTYDNGFVGFWLPDDAEGVIEVSHQGRSGTTTFSTGEDGATCVADLQLV